MEHNDLTCGTCKKFCGNKWCIAYEANRRQAQYVKSISLLVIFMLLLGVVLNTTFDKPNYTDKVNLFSKWRHIW